MRANLFREGEGHIERRGGAEYPRMGHDAQKPAQNQFRNAKGLASGLDVLEPVAIKTVIWRILTMSVNQHIDIRQDHRRRP